MESFCILALVFVMILRSQSLYLYTCSEVWALDWSLVQSFQTWPAEMTGMLLSYFKLRYLIICLLVDYQISSVIEKVCGQSISCFYGFIMLLIWNWFNQIYYCLTNLLTFLYGVGPRQKKNKEKKKEKIVYLFLLYKEFVTQYESHLLYGDIIISLFFYIFWSFCVFACANLYLASNLQNLFDKLVFWSHSRISITCLCVCLPSIIWLIAIYWTEVFSELLLLALAGPESSIFATWMWGFTDPSEEW